MKLLLPRDAWPRARHGRKLPDGSRDQQSRSVTHPGSWDGLYHYAGSDPNLFNDRFERNHTNISTGGHGTDACIQRGDKGMLPGIDFWWNNIESYYWATDAQCRAAGIIDLQ